MNVLAHIYLSGDSEKIIIGNYIGDYVKGKDYLKYPDLVRKGIILHRHIDGFTDRHPVVHPGREPEHVDGSSLRRERAKVSSLASQCRGGRRPSSKRWN